MSLRSDAWRIAHAAIRSADPASAVRRSLVRTPLGIRVGRRVLPSTRGRRVFVVAIGKAAGAMVDAALDRVGHAATGIAFTPRGYPPPRSHASVVFGEHPVPGPASFAAGRRLLDHVRSLSPNDSVLFLLSGGGSATVESPAVGVRPVDLSRATQLLLGSGAPIQSMNAVRRHVSRLKGGRLALACPSRSIATVAISDVVGDAPSDIASGPTVGDPSSYADALATIRRFGLASRMPRRVLEHLRAGADGKVEENPRPDDLRLRGLPFVVAASNRQAVVSAVREARQLGYRSRAIPAPVVGETRAAGRQFAQLLVGRPNRQAAGQRRALIAGGETTVTLGRRPGRGGRNSEFALAASLDLHGDSLVLSVGTDGIDGPTDAAGGWADARTVARAAELGLDLEKSLDSHSTYDMLDRLGQLVRTGPTGTNVMDVHVGLSAPSSASGVSRGTGGSSRRRAARTSRRRRS
jgi:glycerate 2-kinase